MSRRDRLRLAIALALAAGTIAVFWSALGNPFVSYDDTIYVTENAEVREGLTLRGIGWAFSGIRVFNYHPLTILSHMLDVTLFGLEPTGHHAVSVLLHAANAVLLFLALERMTRATWRSACVAALFAAHPLHVESVAWVAERKDVLSTLFWMATLLAYARYATAPDRRRYLAVAAWFTLGLLAKPMVVTLPFVLLLLDFWPLRREEPVARLVIEKLPLFALSAVLSVITAMGQLGGTGVSTFVALPLTERLTNAVVAYVAYLGQMLWPLDLTFFYPHPLDTLALWKVALAVVALMAITALALQQHRSRPWLAVGWLWYLGTTLPVIGILQVGSQAMADRYTYVPLIGVFVAVVWQVGELCAHLAPRSRWSTPALVVATSIIIAALSWLTHLQIAYWRSDVALYERAIAVTDNNWLAHGQLGLALETDGRLDEAVVHYNEAIRIFPAYTEARTNLGLALTRNGELEAGLEQLREAVRLDPGAVGALNNLAAVLGGQGRHAEALEYLQRALEIEPRDAQTHYNLAVSLLSMGRPDLAAQEASEAVRLDPGHEPARNLLALLQGAARER